MPAEQIRLIQVGAGWWGKRWLEVIQNNSDCRLVGLVSRTRETLDEVCREFPISPACCMTDYKKAFDGIEADAAVVLVPPALQADVATAALESGLHVLMEKPLAATWEDALRIHSAWRTRSQATVMIAQTRRWSNHILALKRFLGLGRLGRIGLICIDYRTHKDLSGWRQHLRYPLLEDMSVHHFDAVRYLTGCEPLSVFCHSFRTPWEWFDGCSGSTAVFEMSQGVIFNYLGCQTAQGQETSPEGDIAIVGEKGTVELLGEDKLTFYLHDGQPQPIAIGNMPRSYIDYALDEFCRALKEHRRPECDIGDNLKTFAAVWAAIESSNTGKRVSISKLLKRVEQ